MALQHKAMPVEFKAEGDQGRFSALVSVFGNIDHSGDRMLPGSFTKTLENWRASGDPLPVVFNHDWGTADAHIGVADPRAVMETDEGLLVQGELDIADNPVAERVYKLLKRRSLKSFSFGYKVPKGGQEQKNGANEISEVELFEVGPTLVGANPGAELREIKSALGVEESEVEEKAVWSAAFINDLPDSSFLYIEPGGEKDSEGKTTPRSLRHFPVKGPDGSIDMPHLRNALSRIPQSNLPQSVKDRCTAAAQRMMNNTSSSEPEEKEAIERDDGTHEEPSPAKSHSNALKERSLAASLEVLREGALLEKRTAPEPDPELDYWELKRRSQMAVLDVLSEGALHD